MQRALESTERRRFRFEAEVVCHIGEPYVNLGRVMALCNSIFESIEIGLLCVRSGLRALLTALADAAALTV